MTRLRQRWAVVAPAVLAWVVRVTAVVSVIDILTTESQHYFNSPTADAVSDGAGFAIAGTVAGIQLVLAGGLRRRKRRAWWLMVIVAAAGVVTHVARTTMFALTANLVVLVLLLVSHKQFTARPEPASRSRVLATFLVMAGLSFAIGLGLTRHQAPTASWGELVSSTFFGLVGFAPNVRFEHPELSYGNQVALTSLGVLTVAVTVLVLLSPARKLARLSPDDDARLRELLKAHGDRDSLGYFALRRDKSVVFSPSGKAAVTYRVLSGVSLASGDPLGDPEAWPAAIDAWLAEAESFGWVPGVIGCSESGATAYVRKGLDALEIGDEAVLELADFSLEGRSRRTLRQAVGRVQRAGYTATVRRQRDLSAEEMAEVEHSVDAFRDGEVERGFSMALGRLGDPADPDLVHAVARDCEGRMVGVLSFVPWGSEGLSLDVMRRAKDSENGTVEFLVVAVANAAPDLGVKRISLNFAVFRSAFERGGRVGAGPVLRMWRQVLLVASRWWQIESLYRASAKYGPRWVPRYAGFARASQLPRITLAALEAEAFLVRPRLFRRYG